MEEYIRFMNRKNRTVILKLFFYGGLLALLLGTVAYLNTRYNGFGDVHPAAYYYEKIAAWWQRVCHILFLNTRRFINFFN